MGDLTMCLTLAAAGLLALAMLVAAGLAGWRGWLQLRLRELEARGAGGTGARIELADLRERVRRLEAIAAGVEL